MFQSHVVVRYLSAFAGCIMLGEKSRCVVFGIYLTMEAYIYPSVGGGYPWIYIGPRANLAIHHGIEHGTDFVDSISQSARKEVVVKVHPYGRSFSTLCLFTVMDIPPAGL